jgi:hypothetical protein
MSEQPGNAAGTAEANEPPDSINFNKPWTTRRNSVGLIQDHGGKAMAYVVSLAYGMGSHRSQAEVEAIAKHIVACVNFCQNLDSEVLEALACGEYRIHIERIEPAQPNLRSVGETVAAMQMGEDLRADIARSREQFFRDLRNGDATLDGPLPGGAL